MSYCIVVPHYNHAEQFAHFLPRLLSVELPIIVVDDGSQPEQLEHLQTLANAAPGVQLAKHSSNRGKGAAMITGAQLARSLGHTHMLQIDADGQHDATQLGTLIEESHRHPHALISGAPVFAADAPRGRIYGRKVTDFFVALETLSLGVKDSLCGFRVYPLLEFEEVLKRYPISRGMGVDTDMIVKSSWEDIELRFVDVRVSYSEDGVSHFHYLRDNLQLIGLHTRLLLGALLRLPRLVHRRRLRGVT